MRKQYYHLCSECEHLYHCFGREVAENIQKGETGEMYLRPESCRNYYPEVKQ